MVPAGCDDRPTGRANLGRVESTVVDRPERHRFEILAGESVAGFADYRLRPGEITFTHTEVDDAYEGKGLGSVLVRHALDAAREQGLAVLPVCPFVRAWIARHPDYVDLVPTTARERYGLPT
jgi:predicted GNAT family acetyltransferase